MNLFHHSERLFSGHLNINKNIDILTFFDILIYFVLSTVCIHLKRTGVENEGRDPREDET